MGQGSRNYSYYYLWGSFAYFVLSVATFAALASVTSSCSEKCPLLLEGNEFGACVCNGYNAYGWLPPNSTDRPSNSDEEFQRWSDIHQLVYQGQSQFQQHCYICQSSSSEAVFEACPAFADCTVSGVLGFRPASISADTQCDTNSQNTGPASSLTSGTVTSRKYVNVTLYFIASFMLFLSIAALICFIGFQAFAPKFENDWKKLTRTERTLGLLCKLMPMIARVINIILMICIVIALVFVYAYRVCETDKNEFGETAFYNTTHGLMAAIAVLWVFMCIFGTIFNLAVPRDTPFYAPRFPTDHNDSKCTRCLIWTGGSVIRYGP